MQQFFKNISLWFPEFYFKLLPPLDRLDAGAFLILSAGVHRRFLTSQDSQSLLMWSFNGLRTEMSVACCCWLSIPGVMNKFRPVQLETTPSRLQSANGDYKMPLIESRGLISDSVKCENMPQNQWNMPILTTFPFLTNFLFLLGWVGVLIFFIGLFCNVPITEFSQMSNILSQYYLLTAHKWFR